MTYIPNVSMHRCEYAIENSEVDRDLPGAPGYAIAPQGRWQDNNPIDMTSPLPELAPGHSYYTSEYVTDTAAIALQRRLGFDTWQHNRMMYKPIDGMLQVTDSLYWPATGSTAQRSYTVTRAVQGVELSMDPWEVNIQNVAMAGMIAGRMRNQMADIDAGYPSRLTRYTDMAAAAT